MTLKTLRPPLRFPDHGVAGLRPRPRRSLLGAAHVQLPLHHGPPQTQTSTRHHWPAGSSYGELVLCQTSLSDPVNCSNRCCSSVGRATCSLCQDLSGVHFLLVLWIQVYKHNSGEFSFTSTSRTDGSNGTFLHSQTECVHASALQYISHSSVVFSCSTRAYCYQAQ